MTRVSYIVTPKDKKKEPFEVKTLAKAIAETENRTTGDFKAKYTKVDESFLRE